MSKSLSIREWAHGLKSPGGALATSGESKSKAAGHAALGVLEGGLTGLATGIASSLLPGGLSGKQIGAGSLVAAAVATAMASKPAGRHLANVSVGLAAIAAHEHAGNKAAHAAGTTSSVLTNKAKAIAAHGEDSMGGEGGFGEDRLITEGARIFGG